MTPPNGVRWRSTRLRARGTSRRTGRWGLTREEGWKEVKLSAVSAVEVLEAGERAAKRRAPSRREGDGLVKLTEHSYRAGIWDADTMGERQHAEGLRRGLDRLEKLRSVNDAEVIARLREAGLGEMAIHGSRRVMPDHETKEAPCD